MVTFVKEQRDKDPQLLLLNGGDDFMGNEWDRHTGMDPPAAFMKLLRPDAMVSPSHLTEGVPQVLLAGNWLAATFILRIIQEYGSQEAPHHGSGFDSCRGYGLV